MRCKWIYALGQQCENPTSGELCPLHAAKIMQVDSTAEEIAREMTRKLGTKPSGEKSQ